MFTTLLIEALLASALAAVIGFFLERFKGARDLLLLTGLANLATFVVILFPYLQGYLPFEQLSAAPRFSPGYLGNIYLVLEIAIWTYVLSGYVGYFLDNMMGALMMDLIVAASALVCIFFSAPGQFAGWFTNNIGCAFDPTGQPNALCSLLNSITGFLYAVQGDLTLLLGIIVVGIVGPLVFSRMLKGKGAWPIRVLWFGFCASCWLGYWAIGRLGLVLLTLPTLLLFWGALYYLSQHTLPLQADQRRLAFRSLLTFALGTNYPYYVIGDWKNQKTQKQDRPKPHVEGDPYAQFLAGPGIVLNDCNHLAIVTDGTKFWVAPPGLSFTKQFEQLYADVDLRPQLRATTVAAETKDGIRVKIFTFMPNRVDTGGKQLALGDPYPFNEEAVLKAVTQNAVIDHHWKRDDQSMATEDAKRTLWEELVLMMGPPILKDIILNYTCNQLHAPGDPRVKIAGDFRAKLKETMLPLGIETVGGGISNIEPPDDVVEQRIRNWAAGWKRQIEIERGETDAEITRQLEPVAAEAQLEVMNELGRILMHADEVADEMLAFQLVEALSEAEQPQLVAPPSDKQRGLPSEDALIKQLLSRRGR